MPKGVLSEETIKAKYGSREGYSKAMRELGRLGGLWKGDKGFAKNPELARLAGQKSRRTKKEDL